MSKYPLPKAPEIEAAYIASILISGGFDLVDAENLTGADFSDNQNRAIFEAAMKLKDQGESIDVLNIIATVDPEVVPPADIIGKTITDHNIYDAMNQIPHLVKFGVKREIYTHAVRAMHISQSATPEADIDGLIDDMNKTRARLAPPAILGTAEAIEDLKALQLWRRANPGQFRGHACLIPELSKMLDGWLGGKVYIKAGRPAMGKSADMVSEADHGISKGKKIAIFSIEMGGDELIARMIARRMNIPVEDVNAGRMTDAQFLEQDRHFDQIRAGLLSNYSGDISPSRIKSQLDRWTMKGHKIDMVFIDHIGILKADGKDKTEVIMMGEKIKALREIAKSYGPDFDKGDRGTAFIVLSQLSRAVENREIKMPQLSDLKWSSAIEENAQAVIFLHREAYYDQDIEADRVNILSQKVAKNRQGPTGLVECYFDGPKTAVYALKTETINL